MGNGSVGTRLNEIDISSVSVCIDPEDQTGSGGTSGSTECGPAGGVDMQMGGWVN